MWEKGLKRYLLSLMELNFKTAGSGATPNLTDFEANPLAQSFPRMMFTLQ